MLSGFVPKSSALLQASITGFLDFFSIIAISLSAAVTPCFISVKKIITSAIRHANKDDLILIALGPTATVLSFDLAQLGYTALDIGNVDNEYEWYLAGATKKVRNPLKFSMEVRGGASPEECLNEVYIQQIIEKS